MIRLFVTDLDGTLLNSNKSIDDRNRFGQRSPNKSRHFSQTSIVSM